MMTWSMMHNWIITEPSWQLVLLVRFCSVSVRPGVIWIEYNGLGEEGGGGLALGCCVTCL